MGLCRLICVYSTCLALLGSCGVANEVHDLSLSDMDQDMHTLQAAAVRNTSMAASNASNNSFVTPNPVPPLHPPGSEAPGEDDANHPAHYNPLGPGIANSSSIGRPAIPLNESLAPPQTITSVAPAMLGDIDDSMQASGADQSVESEMTGLLCKLRHTAAHPSVRRSKVALMEEVHRLGHGRLSPVLKCVLGTEAISSCYSKHSAKSAQQDTSMMVDMLKRIGNHEAQKTFESASANCN